MVQQFKDDHKEYLKTLTRKLHMYNQIKENS